MGQRECSVDGCVRPVLARGWCGTHYSRWRKDPDLPVDRPRFDPMRRLMRRVTVPDDPTECWIWNGLTDEAGYGRISWEGNARGAHRVSYMLHVGEIPEGLHLDHLCRTPACVNPAHLDPVSPGVNVMRAQRRLACRRGHLLVGDNVKWRKNGKRECRECVNALWRDRYYEIPRPTRRKRRVR